MKLLDFQKLRLLYIPTLLSMLLALSSCLQKELDFDSIKSQKWSSQWALPLIDSRLELSDLLTDTSGIVHEGGNGLISLVYQSEELISVSAEDFTNIPDQSKNEQVNFDIPNLPPNIAGSVPVDFSFTFELEEEGLRIDSMMVKSGFYHFRAITNLDKDITGIDFEVPNFINRQTNQSMQFSLSMDNPGGGTIENDTLFDLSQYVLKFDHAFSDTNEIIIHSVVHFITDDQPPNNPYFVEIENSFTDILFHQFFGYAGYQEISLSDTINLDIFDINQQGNFVFGPGSVILNIHALNSFGLPVSLDFNTFRAYRGDYSDSLDIYLFGEGNPTVIGLNSPTINQIGESVPTDITSTTSNLNEVLALSPSSIYVDVTGKLNVDGNPENTNFLLDTSRIRASVNLELQLFGQVNNFHLKDTIDFNLGSIEDVESLLFVVDIENGFPINTEIQLTFIDSLNQDVYKLLPDNELLMIAAAVSSAPDYKVISPAHKTTEIVLSREDLDAVEQARKIIIDANLFTTENQQVKIYSDYGIDLKLGAKVGINY